MSGASEPTPYQLLFAEAEAMSLIASRNRCVQKGVESDTAISMPIGFINFLKKNKALPQEAQVVRLHFIDREHMERSALVGISYDDLMQRRDRIDWVLRTKDKNARFPLPADQYFRQLQEMVALAQQHPEYEEVHRDPACRALGVLLRSPEMRKQLRNNPKPVAKHLVGMAAKAFFEDTPNDPIF